MASESDRQWESVIVYCDNLVRPSCQSASFQHTRAGSSDKPVPLNNTKERQAENTPCCVNQLIGRTTWAEGTKGPEGQTRVGQLLLILLSFVLGFSFNLKGQRGDFLTEKRTCCLCLPWPAQLVQQMLMIQVNAAAPFMPYWLHCVHASREWLCRSAHCVLQQSNSNHIWHRVHYRITPCSEAALPRLQCLKPVNALWCTRSLTDWQESQHFPRQINI